ncbi:hypothetical protein B296_00016137 [Ensete ventricosum]|uniref:Uncharacterized protein n=1 Tax=Ensete ventricosum TaxID=4639 RepID=A0A426ZUT2_ENSVE|nr:hypothetical protein B296_00016137 [Ensete ventricosum]
MGGSLAGLGGLTVESAQIPRYGRFSRPTWVAQPLTAARNPGYGDTTVAYLWFTYRNLRKSGSLHFSNFGLNLMLTNSLVN